MEEIYSRPLLFGVVIDRKIMITLNEYITEFSSLLFGVVIDLKELITMQLDFKILVPVIRGSYRSEYIDHLDNNILILVPCYSG